MRIATVLAVASLGGVFGQDEPLLNDLSSPENETLSIPQLLLLVPSDYTDKCWNPPQCCEITSSSGALVLGNTCKLPIPFPTDNYVSDKRINRYDDSSVKTAKSPPYIEITSTPGISTGGVAWSYYVQHPLDVQSKITFTTPGLYTLGISARDYESEASCDGCVAILDKFRPRFKGGCPSSLPIAPTLSTTNKATDYETSFDKSVSDDKRENNAGSGEYCNEESYTVKNFYEDEQPLTGKCFTSDTLSYNVNKLKTNPFADPLNLQKFAVDLDPLLNNKCVWTCTKSITLKELFVEYACPSTTPDPVCSGRRNGNNKCSMNVVISSTAHDIATASFKIKENVQQASTKALAELRNDAGDVVSTVHYITPCTNLDKTSDCTYKTKVSDLIKLSSTKVAGFPGSGASEDYVFWRYNLGGGTWKKLNSGSDVAEEFTDAFTTVNLQAWTACGKIGEFHFDIKLYTHSELTCDQFNSLWSAPDMETRGGAFCSVPGSDFSIFNLNYNYSTFLAPNTGSNPLANGQYKDVTCRIMVAENDDYPGYDQVPFPETSYDDFLKNDDKHPTFTKEFAVELVHDPHTAHKTFFTVECTVTRSSYNGNGNRNNDHNGRGQLLALNAYGPDDINTVTCPATFYLTDCEIPKLGDPSGICTDKCAGKAAPSVNEVCGGTVVTTASKTTGLGTVVDTVVSSDNKQCCKDCNLLCNPVSTASTRTSSIKRCEYTTPATIAPVLLTELAAAEQKILSSETVTALLGASAMVAVVALIVVKRRADAAARAQEAEDAYYPLLE